MQALLDRLRQVEILNPDDISLEEVVESVNGEGLTRRQARQVLIDEMNKIKQGRNVAAFTSYNNKLNAYITYSKELREFNNGKREEKPKCVTVPKDSVYTPIFSKRGIHEAVNMARHRGGYEELLKNCGF